MQYSPGGSLSVALVSGPTSGTLTLTNTQGAADGSFTYTPAADTTGWVYFSYDVHSSDGAVSPPAWAAVDVTDTLPLLPHANDSLTTYENQSQVIDPRLENVDAEHPLDTLTATVVPGMGPQNGTLTANGDGTYTYTPEPGYTGPDYFTYQVSDGVTTSTHGVVSQSDNVNGNYETMFINVQPLPVSVSIGAYAPGDPNAVIPLDDGSYVWDNQTPVNLNYPDDLLPGSIVTVSIADNSDPAVTDASGDSSPVNNGEGDPIDALPGDPAAPVTGIAPMGGVQLWTGYPGDPGSTQVMGSGVSIAQNPSGFSLQFVVGGDNAVPLTHSLIAYGLSPSAYDGLNVLLDVIPAAGNQTGGGSPTPTAPGTPVRATAPATVPAPASPYHVTDVVFASRNDAEEAANSPATNRGADFHTIARDDGTSNYLGSWQDASKTGNMSAPGSRADPLSYTRSGAADGNVYLRFHVWIKSSLQLVAGAAYSIEAVDVKTGKELGVSGPAAVNLKTATLDAAFDTSKFALVKSTVYFGHCDIAWLVSADSGTTWTGAGDTDDKVYVTNANPLLVNADGNLKVATYTALDAPLTAALLQPVAPGNNNPLLPIPESVLYIGCRSAYGQTAKATILSKVWAAFAGTPATGLRVADAEGNILGWYGPESGVRLSLASPAAQQVDPDGDPPGGQFLPAVDPATTKPYDSPDFHSAAGLCKLKDGRCGAWANLMVSVLAAQGIATAQVEVTPTVGGTTSPAGMTQANSLLVYSNIAAQGCPHPSFYQRWFGDHAVVMLAGPDAALGAAAIYDPSFGKVYNGAAISDSELAWETASVHAVYFGTAATPPSIYSPTIVSPTKLARIKALDFTFTPTPESP